MGTKESSFTHFASCFAKARKAKRFERALECTIPDEVYDAMQARIAEAEEEAHAE